MHHKADKDRGAEQPQCDHDSGIVELAGETEPQRRRRHNGQENIDRPVFTAVEDIHHGPHRRLTLMLLFPVFGFRDVFPQPQRKNNRHDANEKERTPSPDRYHQAVDLRGNHRPDGKAGDQKTTGLVTQLLWPAFNDIGRTGSIFPRHPHANHQTGDKQGGKTGGKAAGQRADGKENNTGDHSQPPSVTIAHCAQHQAAKPARNEGG